MSSSSTPFFSLQSRRTHRVSRALFLVLATCLTGCREEDKPQATPAKPASPPPAVKLTVLIAGDEPLAEGVQLLRGEWKARSGGELEVSAITLDELDAAAESPPADVVIFPSRWLGALAERRALRPMRESVLEAPDLGLADVYPAIREAEMKYGGQTLALPLGSPPLMLCWGLKEGPNQGGAAGPPSTWEDYRQSLALGRPNAKPAALPSADHAAAYTLIARALAYTESHRRAEALFDPESMAPRITEAPWVRALAEITEEGQTQSGQSPMNFAQAIQAVMSGQSPATLGWPTLLNQDDDTEAAESEASVQFAPLPTAAQVYSSTRQDWENQLHPQTVTLLGVEGRLVAVTQATRNAVSAFKLAQWLTSGDVAVQLSSRSRGTLWYRKSQTSSYSRWMGGERRIADSPPITQQVADLLAIENPFLVPRVPGIDEYLNTLGDAVRSAKPTEAGAQTALGAAAAKWEELTEQLGREAQASAYRRHLGIEAFE